MLRIQHCLENGLTDGAEVVSFMHRPRPNSQNTLFISVFGGVHFWKSFNISQSLVPSEGLDKLKKFNYVIGSRTCDLHACIIVPHPQHYHVHIIMEKPVKYRTTTCHGDNFTPLYVDDVRTSQKIHLWVSMACFGDSFSLLHIGTSGDLLWTR
jgi:hypothetical protein